MNTISRWRTRWLGFFLCLGIAAPVFGQIPPINGIRQGDVRRHALVDVTAVTAPGKVLEHATILMRDGVIEAVGANLVVPAGYWIHDGVGMTVTAGFIEPALLLPSSDVASRASAVSGAHWNRRVTPQVSYADLEPVGAGLRKELLSLGFTSAAVFPGDGIFSGSGAVISMAENASDVVVYSDRPATMISFEHGRSDGQGYPSSLMGSIALIRQTLSDARWYDKC